MKNFKKVLMMAGSLVLTAALAIGGTVAYLQDEQSDVNVMTLGNVQIEQVEQERDENGNLVPFSQAKPAYPAVGGMNWSRDLVVNGAKCYMTEINNVVDKIVTVNNTGKSDAYVRTIVAIEAPEGDPNNLIMVNWYDAGYDSDPAIEIKSEIVTEIDGVTYYIAEVVYIEALAAGAKSAPSLLQVYLTSAATNEDCAKFGNTWDILVLSQAVQTAGFDNAQTALDTAFGDVTEAKAIEWFGGILENPYALVTVLDENDTLTNAEGVTIFGENRKIDTTKSKMGYDLGVLNLDTAYQFEPYMSAEEGAASEYADWHADFVVKVDKDIPAYSVGLAGYYDAWCSLNNDKWVMLASPEAISAETEIRLIEAMGRGSITVSYEELCKYGNDGIGFLCGAVDLSGMEIDGNTVAQLPAGTTITVELRLYEATGGSANTETGRYITADTKTFTF